MLRKKREKRCLKRLKTGERENLVVLVPFIERDLHQPSGYHHPAKSGHLKPPKVTFSFIPYILHTSIHSISPSSSSSLTLFNIIISFSLSNSSHSPGIHSKRMKRKICDDDSKDPVHLSFCFTKTHSSSFLFPNFSLPLHCTNTTSNCLFFFLQYTTNK